MKKKGTTELGATAPQKKEPVKAEVKKKTRKQKLAERLLKAGVVGADKMTYEKLYDKLKQLKAEGKIGDDRENNHRPESLSKDPEVSKMRKDHLHEEVEVIVTNNETKQTTTTKRKTMIAILDMLRQEALKHKNIQAAHEYFDRTLGKAKQEIELSDIEPDEQRLPTKAERAAAKAYLAVIDEEGDDE